LAFGEQIGWFNPNIINRSDCGKFLRDCIQLRWRLKEYFYAGRMARPPKLTGNVPTVTADWQWRGEWPITTSAIMTGTWRLENENKIVLLFVNVSDHSLTTHFEFNPGEYNLSGKSFGLVSITPDGHQDEFTIQATDRRQVKFAPRSVFAWEISPTSED
jgi:hypothetical protein